MDASVATPEGTDRDGPAIVEGLDGLYRFALLLIGSSDTAEDKEDELFYVVEGEVRFMAGEADTVVPAGGVAWLPKKLAHQFQVLTDTARDFQVTTPAQFEEFVAKLGTPSDTPTIPMPVSIDGAEVARVCAAFDIQVLGPPLAPPD